MLTPEELQRLMVEARRERSLAIAAMVAQVWRRLRRAMRRVAERRPERLARPRACG
jgi:hypothetical protein